MRYSFMLAAVLLSGCSSYTVGEGNSKGVCIRHVSGVDAGAISDILRQHNNVVLRADCPEPYVDVALARTRVATAFDGAALASAYRYDYTVTYTWHVDKTTQVNTNRESLALYRTDVGVKQTLNASAMRDSMHNRLAERIRLQTRVLP